MIKISACVITKNEAHHLTRCLESVKDIVDEIIVVDTGSIDDTVNIAKRLGAAIFFYQWNNNFAAAKNYALQQAKGDWIVFLDADEYIQSDKIQNVRPLLEKLHSKENIESVTCRMVNLEAADGAYRSANPIVRIFRNSIEIRYQGRIHEGIFKNNRPTNTINVDELVICHTGYTQNTLPNKIKRNMILLENDVVNGHTNGLTYYYLSDGYWHLQEYENAIKYAQKVLNDKDLIHANVAEKPYVILMNSMSKLKYKEEIIDTICKEAIKKFPCYPEIWLFQGLYFRSIGRYQRALESFMQSIETDIMLDERLAAECKGLIPKAYAAACFNIAEIYELGNDPEHALEYYFKIIQQNRYNEEAFDALVSLIRDQRPEEIVYLLNSIYHVSNEIDLEFLVFRLSKLKLKKVFGYYHHFWCDQFGHEEFIGIMLLIEGKFDKAFQIFSEHFHKTGNFAAELVAVQAIILGKRMDWIDGLEPLLNLTLKRIVHAFFQSEQKGNLQNEDFLLYSDLVKQLAYVADDEQMERLLGVCRDFDSSEFLEQIGDVLLTYRLFHDALKMYLHYLDKDDLLSEKRGVLYNKAGFCCFRLRDFGNAVYHFEKALECGYREHQIFDFLEWSYQQCNQAVLKKKIAILRDLVDK